MELDIFCLRWRVFQRIPHAVKDLNGHRILATCSRSRDAAKSTFRVAVCRHDFHVLLPRTWSNGQIFRLLAGRNPHHLDTVADHVGRALLASAALGHSGSSPLIRVDCAAPITEGTFDLLAPAAFIALTAKTAKHAIEEIFGVPD